MKKICEVFKINAGIAYFVAKYNIKNISVGDEYVELAIEEGKT